MTIDYTREELVELLADEAGRERKRRWTAAAGRGATADSDPQFDPPQSDGTATKFSKQDQTQYILRLSVGLMRGIALRNQLRLNADFEAREPLWQTGAGKIADEEAATIANPILKEGLYRKLEQDFAQERSAIASQAARDHKADLLEGIAINREHLAGTVGLVPDPLHEAAVEAHNALIDTVERNGYLDHDAALAEKRRSATALTRAYYNKMARIDPARALSELNSPDCPHPVVKFLPPETKGTLIADAQYNQDADRLDAERATYLEAQHKQRASDEAEAAVLKDLTSESPTVTVKSLVNDERGLTPAAGHRMLDLAARTARPDPPEQDSNQAALEFLERIGRPGNDAERITSMAPVLEGYNDGKLNRRDFDSLARHIADASTPEGAALAQRRQSFINAHKGLIDQSDPSAGRFDHIGKAQLHRLEGDLDRKIERCRRDGRDPLDLFDPSKSDYVGKPEALQPYAQEALTQNLEQRLRELRSAAAASVTTADRRATSEELANARAALRRGADHHAVINRFNAHGVDFSAL